MRRTLALAIALLSACSSAPRIEPWEQKQGMDAPESAYYYEPKGWVFVSQVGGSPMEKDGNGRISILTLDGTVVKADWITGLNAPKGLRAHGGRLWAADIDELVEIDIASARVLRKLAVEGAKFLNDVAIGSDGTVYVSDTLISKIFAAKNGKSWVFAEGDAIEYPNGLLVEGNSLVVAGWGKPEADFTTTVPGRLFKLDLRTKAKTLITKEPTGNLDGLESDGDDGYIVTDWMAGKVLHVSAEGQVKLLKQFKQGTADCAFLPDSRTLILPHMLENRVAAYDLSAELP